MQVRSRSPRPAPADGRQERPAEPSAWADPAEPGLAVLPARQPVAAAPRASRCSRATRWLAGMAGLGALMGLGLYCAAARPAGAGTPLVSRKADLPQGVPPAGVDPTPGYRDDKRLLEMPASSAFAAVPAALSPLAPERVDPPRADPRLVKDLEAALATRDSRAVQELALRLEDDGVRSDIDPETVGKIVRAFRASRYGADAPCVRPFIDGLLLAIGHSRTHDEHVRRLLDTWGWRSGDAQVDYYEEPSDEARSHQREVILVLAVGLGGRALSDAHARLIIGSICQEPGNIPPGTISDRPLALHAWWASLAFEQLWISTSFPRLGESDTKFNAMRQAKLRKYLRMLLDQPASDPRWKPLLLAEIHKKPPEVKGQPQMQIALWRNIILRQVRDYLGTHAHDVGPTSTMEEALTTLYDPTLPREGVRIRLT